MYHNIMKFSKWPKLTKDSLALFSNIICFSIIIVVIIKLFNLNHIFKKEGLYSQVNNITNIKDSLICRIPFNHLFFPKILAYRTTKSVIYSMIITHNRSKLSYDPIVLKDWKKTNKLLLPTVIYYHRKSKESL